MRDFANCQAYVDHLRGEHQRIHEAVQDIESILASSPSDTSQLPAATVSLVTASYLEARYGAPDPDSLQRLEAAVGQI